MALAAPIFYHQVTHGINYVILAFCPIVELAALSHCVVQRSEPFATIGTLSKGLWLGLMAVGLVITALSGYPGDSLSIFAMFAVGFSAVYLLDVRPALRDAVDGHGSW